MLSTLLASFKFFTNVMQTRTNFADFKLFLQFTNRKTDEDDTVHPVRVLMYIQGNVLVT